MDQIRFSSVPSSFASSAPESQIIATPRTVVCFSHLRWDFVFQRPQHLMLRFAKSARVIYWEEPIPACEGVPPALILRKCEKTGVVVATPVLPLALHGVARDTALQALLENLLQGEAGEVVRWYYTPMMLPFSEHVAADCVVYDCMDSYK